MEDQATSRRYFPMLQESFQLEFSTKSYDISKFGKKFKF